MSSQTDTVNNKTSVSNLDNKTSSSKVPLKEPTLKLNMEEYREMKRLKAVGDVTAIENLEKKVRQRMELELASDPTRTATTSMSNKKTATSKQVKSTITTTSSPSGNVSVKNDKTAVVNHKRIETNVSTSKNGNMVSSEDKKVSVKKTKPNTTTTLKSTSEILTINKEKQKEKSKPSGLTSKINYGPNKEKSAAIRQENLISSTSTSKVTKGILLNNKGRQTSVNKDVTGNKVPSSTSANKSVLKFEKYVERWKSYRERDEKYKPLELFLPPEILNDKNRMITIEKIAKEFELERLRKLLKQDMEKPNGNKKLAQKRIEKFNNYGKTYTRLEIAAARNEEGPKTDQKIRAHIAFLNEKNIINKKITSLDVIADPHYLKKGKRKRQQTLEIEKKSEKLGGKLAEQKRHHESVAETKRRQEIERERARRVSKAEVQHRHNRMEDLRSKNSNASKKTMTNRSEATKSTSLKKRTFDERSEVSPSSRAQKRRNVGSNELDICRLDEATVNRNLSSIIHSIVRPGRRPIYGMIDDHDDDAMEVSGYEVLREEARSSRLAKKEDDDEERAEQQRRLRKLNKKKVRG
ncbi:4202_t:CDS:2 [Rhizophagus irregularis]|nr:4202_t:CDS:2 [Rhizophagus irregularis]